MGGCECVNIVHTYVHMYIPASVLCRFGDDDQHVRKDECLILDPTELLKVSIVHGTTPPHAPRVLCTYSHGCAFCKVVLYVQAPQLMKYLST